MNHVSDLVPKDKFGTSNINTLKSVDSEQTEPIPGGSLEWIQDLNWPVAQEPQELIMILPSARTTHSKCISGGR